MGSLTFCFRCGLQGYHEYRTTWNPSIGEVLCLKHKVNNVYDRYAIAATKIHPGLLISTVVGHLPREISRFTYFIIDLGASMTCKVVDTAHRRSPLIQGGLEIPIEVNVEMEVSEKTLLVMNRYKDFVSKHYEELINGVYEDATKKILEDLVSEDTDLDMDEDIDKSEA